MAAQVASIAVRVCLVYDCLYPNTVGGAERWLLELAGAFVEAGHQVTYLTRRQWNGPPPDIKGVCVLAVMGPADLYDEAGRRRMMPPLRFGLGVFGHLLRHPRSYDVVHTCAFPYFALIGARIALVGRHARVGVDWFEAWSDDYWRGYLGSVGGRIGSAVQRLCVRLTPLAFVYSERVEARLRELGQRTPVLLRGLYPGPVPSIEGPRPRSDPPFLLLVGRLIPEKRADLLPGVVAVARSSIPTLRGLVVGDGPGRASLDAAIAAEGMMGVADAPGFVERSLLEDALATAACLLVSSRREGYGIVVLEAMAHGTPVVVVESEDNAAADLIVDGVNGLRLSSSDPSAIADAVVRVVEQGDELRLSTVRWFAANAEALAASTSAARVIETYQRAPPRARSC